MDARRVVLIANRGEIAVRIARAAATLGIRSVAVYAADDADSAHVSAADESCRLEGRGAAAYLDVDQLVAAALRHGCHLVHPGYGFLSERASFAARCTDAGLAFVGPSAEHLALFGDKVRARALAAEQGVAVLPGTGGAIAADDVHELLDRVAPRDAVMVKAVAGGGGRGMRLVRAHDEVGDAVERCQSEALAAFGDGSLYAEVHVARARHVEVQVAGDGTGAVVHLHERDCSIQRRNQKLVEIAPAPGLPDGARARLHHSALAIASAVAYRNIATFEFLVDADDRSDAAAHWFIEANPRIQVEHTVTEEITGVDLVQLQLRLATGATLGELGLLDPPAVRGTAVEARVNAEVIGRDGQVRPSSGRITVIDLPGGPGVRVDTHARAGHEVGAAYDSLVAKVVAWAPGPPVDALARSARAVRELRIAGIDTNVDLLGALLARGELASGAATTTFVTDHLGELLDEADRRGAARRSDLTTARPPLPPPSQTPALAPSASPAPRAEPEPGVTAAVAPLPGTVVSIAVAVGDHVAAGAVLVVIEAMKMEHVVVAAVAGIVRRIDVAPGDTVPEGAVLVGLASAAGVEQPDGGHAPPLDLDLDHLRADLDEVRERHEVGLDERRPDAVDRRRGRGQRTARENIADLVDDGSFVEYAPLAIAAQRRRRTLDDLVARTPADGMVGGLARVNGDLFDDDRARCVVMSYDYTVLAGTQGLQNHRKKDRLFELAARWRLPVVLFSEGGGGRPGDTDGAGVAGLDCLAFNLFARLSGRVPLVGINSGYCFAGNAALLGCCDVVIATANSNIGMGGPAMVEGGGLGVFRPDEIGPMEVQVPNGVVDIAVADEAEAVAAAKCYLSYFQGAIAEWRCVDQRLLRHAIPENRLRVYDVRNVIDLLADTGSVLELRRGFGAGMVTALARIEGRPVGVVANNPTHLAGAIDSPGADKAARFIQLCDAFDLPIVSLCDTPGMMVGPEVERSALVRHCCRLFVAGANATVPVCTVVLRKGYGLGAQAMAAGSFRAPMFTVAWPTGEFGGMGLEGAVKLGYRKELAAVDDVDARRALYDEMVARMYEHGKAVSMASYVEIDDVIDPAETRRWIIAALRSVPAAGAHTDGEAKKHPFVSTW